MTKHSRGVGQSHDTALENAPTKSWLTFAGFSNQILIRLAVWLVFDKWICKLVFILNEYTVDTVYMLTASLLRFNTFKICSREYMDVNLYFCIQISNDFVSLLPYHKSLNYIQIHTYILYKTLKVYGTLKLQDIFTICSSVHKTIPRGYSGGRQLSFIHPERAKIDKILPQVIYMYNVSFQGEMIC